jgi:signal transduction histidine kinase
MLRPLRNLVNSAQEFGARYPALMSGLIIYSYLLFSIVHYLLKTKSLIPTFYDVFETFDALPFMWLLSLALVKIIDVRGRLYKSETERMFVQKQIEIKQTQLSTLHEVVKSLQHHINNPLAIITLTLATTRRQAKDNPELLRQVDAIEESTQRIIRSMKEFFETQSYETERVDAVIGNITVLPSLGPLSSGRENPSVSSTPGAADRT